MIKISALLFFITFSFNAFSNESIEVNANYQKYDKEINVPEFKVDENKNKNIKKIISSSVLGEYSIESIDAIVDSVNGEKWKNKVSKYREIISKDLKIEVNKENLELQTKDRVMVFISESIPIETLRNYAKDLEKVGGVFVMRGMIGGLKTIRPQALFSAEVLRVDRSCRNNCVFRKTEILVDPIMFRKYEIDKVPAIVVQSGLDIFDYCHTTAKFEIEKNVVYGDSSLKYAMEILSEFDKRKSIKTFESIL